MVENKNSKPNLKVFFIKLISILVAVVIAINLIFNLIFAERLEKIDKILLLNKNEYRNEIKEKIRDELNKILIRENRMDLGKACFEFIKFRTSLDLKGWNNQDIFSH